MKRYLLLTFAFLSLFFVANAQKSFSEGTLVYSIDVETASGKPGMADMFDGSTNTLYLKGQHSRVDLISPLGKEITIHDASKGTAVVLKDYSGQKLMITMTAADWEKSAAKYSNISFTPTGNKKNIAGYDCIEAVANLTSGTGFTAWYTTGIKITNKSYDVQFKNLPGLPVQYEMTKSGIKFRFTLSKISYDKVAASRFDIPTSGYRVMTYEEAHKK